MNAGRLRQILVAASILGYALAEQYSNTASAPPQLGALLAIAPLLLALLLLASRTPWPRLTVAMALLAAAGALLQLWPALQRHFARLYLLQQCGVYLALAASFGRSLLPGQTPLCTRWARMVHGELPPDAVRYTRSVTACWCAFFVAIVALSATLYAVTPRPVWSLFANFLILPLAAAMFATEYWLRRRRLPAMPRASLADMLRAYRADPRGVRRL